jgi:hypothetical protein
MSIVVSCSCGKRFKVPDELAGKRGKCQACGQVVAVPKAAPEAPATPASTTPARACPTCRKPLAANAVICVACGLDLRSGKQLTPAKPAAPARPTAPAPASPWLWIALAAGGVGLAGLGVIVAVLAWLFVAGGPDRTARAPTTNPATPTSRPIAVVEAGGPPPAFPTTAAQSAPGGAPIPTVNPAPVKKVNEPPAVKLPVEPPAVKTVEDPPPVKNLVTTVTTISPDDLRRYETFLRDRNALGALLFEGGFRSTRPEVDEAVKLGLQKPALAALARVVQDKKRSADKADVLACARAIKAIGQFGPAARDMAPPLAELAGHQEPAIAAAVKIALTGIGSPAAGPMTPPAAGPGTGPAKRGARPPGGVTLRTSRFVESVALRLNVFGPVDTTPIRAEPGHRLLWAEIRLTQPGLTTIGLDRLRVVDGRGGEYRPAGFKVGLTPTGPANRPEIAHLINPARLTGPVLPKFVGGSSSTESANARIETSPQTIAVTLKRGEAFATFLFVVPADATDLALRDIAGGDLALGTPAGR